MVEPLQSPFDLTGKKIWVTGYTGMVGQALMKRLAEEDCKLLTVPRSSVDLRRQTEIEEWIAANKPDVVLLVAATVGGIHANATRPAEFIYDNLAIETNVIQGAWQAKVQKLFFLGSACIYPKLAPQPMNEEMLLTGPLEPTNQWYAVAKIAGIKMCQAYREQYGCDFITAQPINLYGPGDNFDLEAGHVIPALMAKTHQAKVSGEDSVVVWGTGKPKREFLYVEDLADAVVHMLKHYSGPVPMNIGAGEELTIRELAEVICDIVGFEGNLIFDEDKPDGTPRKFLDTSKLDSLGWTPTTQLRDGLKNAYDWYLENVEKNNPPFRKSMSLKS